MNTTTTINITVNIDIQDVVTVKEPQIVSRLTVDQLQDQRIIKAANQAASQTFRRHRIAQKIAALGGQDLANQYMAGAL